MTTSISKEFKFEAHYGGATGELKLSGALRRGHIESPELQKYQATLLAVQKFADKGLLIFNLEELSYWDTWGINTIIPLIEKLNARHKYRAGILGSKDGLVYEAAFARYKVTFMAKDIPWESAREQLLKIMTGES